MRIDPLNRDNSRKNSYFDSTKQTSMVKNNLFIVIGSTLCILGIASYMAEYKNIGYLLVIASIVSSFSGFVMKLKQNKKHGES